MISARDVSKRYGRTVAVSGVSLEVAAGDGVALCGPRASGKTTLLRLLGSWLEPSSGSIQICGLDARTHLWQARSRISYAASDALVGTGLTVEEYLQFISGTRGGTVSPKRVAVPLGEMSGEARLAPSARVDALTVGERAALALAAAFVAPADVVLIDRALDELDPAPREAWVQRLIEARSHGAALIVTTDTPGLPEGLCNRVLRLKAGRVTETTLATGPEEPELCRG